MMSGQEQPDSGSIVLGDTVKLASVDQFRDSMDGSKTVWEEVSGGQDIMRIGNTEMPSRAYVGRFNFKGVDQGKRVGELSGGERGRLQPSCCRLAATCCCSMNRPTTRISKPCARWKTPCWNSRLRHGDLARPLVPRPYRHPHPGLPGRGQGGILRRQLHRVRRVQEAYAGRRRARAAPHQVQEDRQ